MLMRFSAVNVFVAICRERCLRSGSWYFCRLKVKQSRWEAVPSQRASDSSVSRGSSTVAGVSRGRGVGHRLGHYRNIFSQRSPSSSSSRSSSRSPSPSHNRHRERSNQRHRRRYATVCFSLVPRGVPCTLA